MRSGDSELRVRQSHTVVANDGAIVGLERVDVDSQPVRASAEHDPPGRSACLAHLHEGIGRRRGAARHLQSEKLARYVDERTDTLCEIAEIRCSEGQPFLKRCGVVVSLGGWPVIDVYVLESHIELFCDQRGQCRLHALAHLRARHDDRYARPINPDVRRHCGLVVFEAIQQGIVVRRLVAPVTEGDAAGHSNRGDDETPSGPGLYAAHYGDSFSAAAAALMAARILG